MKKILSVTICLFMCALSAPFANAAVTQGTAGGAVVIDGDTDGNAKDISFNASSNVVVSGASTMGNFAIAAYHTQANLKANGQQFGMASDSNSMWFIDISGTAAAAITASTASQAFTGSWKSM